MKFHIQFAVFKLSQLRNADEFSFSSQFNGSQITFVNELITGWTTALREMPTGSRWEIVIPYNLGYGSRPAGVIKAFSTLVFDITLLDVR